MKTPPLVMIISAVDGTGGAGLIADCRAVSAAGGVPIAIATGLTAQNLDGVQAFWPASAQQLRAQFAAMENAKPSAVKIGAIGGSVSVIARHLPGNAPIVWDPVLSPTAGKPFVHDRQIKQMLSAILPRTDIVTPNRSELLRLSGCDDVTLGTQTLLSAGAKMVLATDLAGGGEVRHALYDGGAQPLWRAKCRRRRGDFHGSGCLFSTTLATRLALGDSPAQAAARAQRTTQSALQSALRLPSLGAQKLIFPAM